MANFVYDELGLTTAAAIHDGDPYTNGLTTAFQNAFEELGGEIVIHKTPTTPDDPSRGVIQGALELCQRHGIDPASLDHLLHGTTIATNAVLERKLPPGALIEATATDPGSVAAPASIEVTSKVISARAKA